MKAIALVMAGLCFCPKGTAQDTLEFYNRGVNLGMGGEYEKALEFFTRSIETHPNHWAIHMAWYNRGLIRYYLKDYATAISDFDSAIWRKPDYLLALNMRGACRKNLKDYDGALTDYNRVLDYDPEYTDALINRGNVYKMMNDLNRACSDWSTAQSLGAEKACVIYERNCGESRKGMRCGVFALIQKTSNEKTYGFDESNPVKVGSSPYGGPGNQEAYLELLRDPQGDKISYKRLGSCCHYATENGFLGLGALDLYEINYRDKNGKRKTAKVYITFYEYEEPLILFGFTSGK